MSIQKRNLSFFMTFSTSLVKWDQANILEREISPYIFLAEHFSQIFIFTYGNSKDYKYKDKLTSNIKVIIKPKFIPSRWYQYLAPLLHLPTIFRSHFLKTNQMHGAKTAIIAKFLNPFAKLIIRTGYTQSLFDAKENKNLSKIKRLEKIAYRFANHSLVTSLADKKYLIEEYKIPKNKISVIANYIDTDIFRPNLKITKLENRLIFVGRLSSQKNLPSLIKALSGLNLSLDLIGEGKQKEELKKLAESEKVSVNFFGTIPNFKLPEILNRYHIFILPSLYEGMPKTLLEAMSCNIACIATNVPGSREVIQNGKNGLLAETSSASLRENILKLINNLEFQKTLGENAREFILKNFSLKTQIQKELSIYQNLTKN